MLYKYVGTARVYLAPTRLGVSKTLMSPDLMKGSICGVMDGFQ